MQWQNAGLTYRFEYLARVDGLLNRWKSSAIWLAPWIDVNAKKSQIISQKRWKPRLGNQCDVCFAFKAILECVRFFLNIFDTIQSQLTNQSAQNTKHNWYFNFTHIYSRSKHINLWYFVSQVHKSNNYYQINHKNHQKQQLNKLNKFQL